MTLEQLNKKASEIYDKTPDINAAFQINKANVQHYYLEGDLTDEEAEAAGQFNSQEYSKRKFRSK